MGIFSFIIAICLQLHGTGTQCQEVIAINPSYSLGKENVDTIVNCEE